MKLTSALIADSAQVQSGKLFVLGGGFDTISVRELPGRIKNISLVMVAELGDEERRRDLELAISLIDEDGAAVGVNAKGVLRVADSPELPPGSPSIVPMVTSFHDIILPEEKGYAFIISLDGSELARVRFRVVQAR